MINAVVGANWGDEAKPSLTPTRSPRTTMLNSNAADSSMSTR